ncbi:MAG: hypothetical protein H0T42_02115 [Deltaproteobacteria bacterium]|nr:hypothetical protein [Deltaproteobacteria bacterium]
MAISDGQFRLGVVGAAIMLVLVMTFMRFCGSVTIPPKPAPPRPTGSQSQLLTKGAATPAVYQEFLQRDAVAAGVRTPSIAEMSRKLVYRGDDARRVLEVGEPAIEVAGVKLRVARDGNTFVLDITNVTTSDLAYSVLSSPTPNNSGCMSAQPVLFNAMVIEKGGTVRRVECIWRTGMALAITSVQTLEVSPLSAYYLSTLPPRTVGVEDRLARGHQAPETSEKCSSVVSQAVRSGLEQGQIGWRDLVDFYARHRCQTYRFPASYRSFKADAERPIPDTAAGM